MTNDDESRDPINIDKFKRDLEKLLGKKSQFIDMAMNYLEAAMYCLETDNFISGQDVTLWAALDLIKDMVQMQTDVNKDVKLTSTQRQSLQKHFRFGNNDEELVSIILKYVPDSEINKILKEIDDTN